MVKGIDMESKMSYYALSFDLAIRVGYALNIVFLDEYPAC